MGKSYAEFKATVGPKNRHAHMIAETIILSRQGVLPLDQDDDQQTPQQQNPNQPTIRGKKLN